MKRLSNKKWGYENKVALYTQHTYNLWYRSGNIETKISMQFINEFVSLLDLYEEGFDLPRIRE